MWNFVRSCFLHLLIWLCGFSALLYWCSSLYWFCFGFLLFYFMTDYECFADHHMCAWGTLSSKFKKCLTQDRSKSPLERKCAFEISWFLSLLEILKVSVNTVRPWEGGLCLGRVWHSCQCTEKLQNRLTSAGVLVTWPLAATQHLRKATTKGRICFGSQFRVGPSSQGKKTATPGSTLHP